MHKFMVDHCTKFQNIYVIPRIRSLQIKIVIFGKKKFMKWMKKWIMEKYNKSCTFLRSHFPNGDFSWLAFIPRE